MLFKVQHSTFNIQPSHPTIPGLSPAPAKASLLRGIAALLLTLLLLGFLVLLRVLNAPAAPDQELRRVEVAPERALPPPPPPPPAPPDTPDAPPPPPAPVPLPRLELRLDDSVPALKASVDPLQDVRLDVSMFDLEVRSAPSLARPGPVAPRSSPKIASGPSPQVAALSTAPPMRSTYDAGELDGTPRLRNHPSASFPAELLRQGIREGRVVLEVQISTSGSVSVRRVLSSNHPLFSEKARAIASGARFTTPTKNGRPVTAIYRWPIVIRP